MAILDSNIPAIVGIIIIIAVILALSIVIIIDRRRRERRQREIGADGERLVSEILASLPAGRYVSLADIMLPRGARTSQIDHIVLSNHGIFVLEVKNYGGAVYGHENAEKWVQYRYGEHRSGDRREFYSPLAQNEAHIAALMELLELPRSCFISAAVFTPRTKLYVRRKFFRRFCRFNNAHVVQTHKLRKFIRKTNSRESMPYNIETAAEIIDTASLDSKRERRVHSKIVKNL
ncbi:MAG: NERD domain-containing protein [Clostridiales bacterium]|nr:NERD domain-containing protein [Clostridiales bacterium]